jgi:hypothetical protein
MPDPVQTNPFGINSAQGNEVYTSTLIAPFATDPAANAQLIAGMTTANPTVITTSVAHGFITGQLVNVNAGTPFVATGTVPNGNFTATVLSATTFSIPFNYTGAYTSGGAVFQNFQPGQLVILQNWNGTVSSAASAPAFPTVALTPLTTADQHQIGVICGYNTLGPSAPPPVLGQSYVVQVVVSGQCQAFFNVTSTAGASNANFSASVAAPGCAKPLAATTGLNIGVALQAVTVTSIWLPQLVQVFVKLS